MATFLSPNPTRPSTANAESEKEFNICLVGSGGIGTVAALVMEKSGRARVTVVLRGSYGIVKEKGFDIESVDHGSLEGWRPTRIVPNIQEATFAPRPTHPSPLPTGASTPMEAPKERYDFLVLCTKQLPDKYSLSALVSPLITPAYTTIVLIQNGIFIHVPFTTAFPLNTTLSAVSMIGSFTEAPNKVKQIGHDILQIGAHYHGGVDDAVSFERAKTFVELYSSGGAKSCTLAPDMMHARYAKLLWNAPFNSLCTLLNMNVGELLRSGARDTFILPMMREIVAVAAKDGTVLSEELVADMVGWSKEESEYKPSMLLDRDEGRPMEIEVILGDVVRRGRELGVDVERMGGVYELLKCVCRKVECEKV